MCPCAQPCCTYFRVGSARGRALAVTAARLKAIGDELQARVQGRRLEAECQRRRQRWASAGTGLATSIVLLLAWAWFSRRRSI